MKRTLTVCCAAHFLVDFSCAYLLFFALRSASNWTELLIVYNFCAFAMQMPLGLLADRWCRDGEIAAAGGDRVCLNTFPCAGHGLSYMLDFPRYRGLIHAFWENVLA